MRTELLSGAFAAASFACALPAILAGIDREPSWYPLPEKELVRGGACFNDLLPVPCSNQQLHNCEGALCEDENEDDIWECTDLLGTISVKQKHTGCSFGEPIGGSSCPPDHRNDCKRVRTCQNCFPDEQDVERCKKKGELDVGNFDDYWPAGSCSGV